MCVCGRVLHACGFGLCVQVCVCGTRLVSVRDASRVWSWCEYEDFEYASSWGVSMKILNTLQV